MTSFSMDVFQAASSHKPDPIRKPKFAVQCHNDTSGPTYYKVVLDGTFDSKERAQYVADQLNKKA